MASEVPARRYLDNGQVKVFVTRDVAEFASRALTFLFDRPVEHNVLATVVARLEPTGATDGPVFGWVEAGAGGRVVGAALRTPPRRLLASSMSAEAADALTPRLLEADPELPGVNGPQPAACFLAEAWRRCTGGTVEPVMSQAIYWLSQVQEAAGRPSGRSRPAEHSDRDLVIEWTRAFSLEAGTALVEDLGSAIDRRLDDGALFVWDDDHVASMVGINPPVAGVVRLGPVYTPPEERRRGYATSLVADVSRRALASGATKCMLYTDLANPTSNSIYHSVGYRRSTDAQEYNFSRN